MLIIDSIIIKGTLNLIFDSYNKLPKVTKNCHIVHRVIAVNKQDDCSIICYII